MTNSHDERVIITRARLNLMVSALLAANAGETEKFNRLMNDILFLKCDIVPTL